MLIRISQLWWNMILIRCLVISDILDLYRAFLNFCHHEGYKFWCQRVQVVVSSHRSRGWIRIQHQINRLQIPCCIPVVIPAAKISACGSKRYYDSTISNHVKKSWLWTFARYIRIISYATLLLHHKPMPDTERDWQMKNKNIFDCTNMYIFFLWK